MLYKLIKAYTLLANVIFLQSLNRNSTSCVAAIYRLCYKDIHPTANRQSAAIQGPKLNRRVELRLVNAN